MAVDESREFYKSTLRLLCVGRLERRQGLHLLFEALRYTSGYELSILGEGSERKNLQFLAIGLNFQFCGSHAEPSNYYRYADIFIMPSLGPEEIPLATIDAMSHGLPCILSDLPAHRELSDNGAAAMLFKCGDPVDLRSRLHTLLNSESERGKYGEAAYQTIQKKYGPKPLVPRITQPANCASLELKQISGLSTFQ